MKKLILLDREWVPRNPGTSLYIRPAMIATEPHLGVRPANTYLFFIILGPVGAYYKEGLNPVKIYVEDKYIRAAVGGLGEAKTAANYAASLLAAEEAKEKGFTQVLWLDAAKRRYVEEVGTMNMFFVMDGEVITAPLNGSILPGVTRDSVIRLVKDWGMKMSERSLDIDELIAPPRTGGSRRHSEQAPPPSSVRWARSPTKERTISWPAGRWESSPSGSTMRSSRSSMGKRKTRMGGGRRSGSRVGIQEPEVAGDSIFLSGSTRWTA